MAPKSFHEVGSKSGDIEVRISYRIIQLFSEGLYSSPNKAIEELVSNAWDAGAEHTHILLPEDRTVAEAKIVVIDDGTGMDAKALQQHWLLGISNKRERGVTHPRQRSPIGRFGIGKLATYVLANRLTHITKVKGKYYSTSMDYERIDSGGKQAAREQVVKLPLRRLTEQQAKNAVAEWTGGKSAGDKALPLFGSKAARSWTVTVMSDLKSMAQELSGGRLHWVLETAMPLGDDFKLYLNGEQVHSSKEDAPRVGTWVLGKDLGNGTVPLPRPASAGFRSQELKGEPESSPKRYGLVHPKLGRIWGHIEAYVDELRGKSEGWGQSNGFYVYVRGRRVNVDDPGFGIDRNKLQHGTFSRIRMVVHIDGLDTELRSSRETLRTGEVLDVARNLLVSGFNFARSRLADHDTKTKGGATLALRVAHSPASLTVRPIASLLGQVLEGTASPRYLQVPSRLSKASQQELLDKFDAENENFVLIKEVQLAQLSSKDGIARFDVESLTLHINTMHPFVAHFLDEFESGTRSLPLELFAVSEILLEAHLYQTLDDEDEVHEVVRGGLENLDTALSGVSA